MSGALDILALECDISLENDSLSDFNSSTESEMLSFPLLNSSDSDFAIEFSVTALLSSVTCVRKESSSSICIRKNIKSYSTFTPLMRNM